MTYKMFDGKNITVPAPAGGVTKGVPIKFGDMVLLPAETAKEGQMFTGEFSGVFGGMKLDEGVAPKYAGEKAFLKKDTNVLTTVATANTHCGFFVTTPDGKGVLLQGLG